MESTSGVDTYVDTVIRAILSRSSNHITQNHHHPTSRLWNSHATSSSSSSSSELTLDGTYSYQRRRSLNDAKNRTNQEQVSKEFACLMDAIRRISNFIRGKHILETLSEKDFADLNSASEHISEILFERAQQERNKEFYALLHRFPLRIFIFILQALVNSIEIIPRKIKRTILENYESNILPKADKITKQDEITLWKDLKAGIPIENARALKSLLLALKLDKNEKTIVFYGPMIFTNREPGFPIAYRSLQLGAGLMKLALSSDIDIIVDTSSNIQENDNDDDKEEELNQSNSIGVIVSPVQQQRRPLSSSAVRRLSLTSSYVRRKSITNGPPSEQDHRLKKHESSGAPDFASFRSTPTQIQYQQYHLQLQGMILQKHRDIATNHRTGSELEEEVQEQYFTTSSSKADLSRRSTVASEATKKRETSPGISRYRDSIRRAAMMGVDVPELRIHTPPTPPVSKLPPPPPPLPSSSSLSSTQQKQPLTSENVDLDSDLGGYESDDNAPSEIESLANAAWSILKVKEMPARSRESLRREFGRAPPSPPKVSLSNRSSSPSSSSAEAWLERRRAMSKE